MRPEKGASLVDRRRVIFALGAAVLAHPVESLAQPSTKVARIGFFYNGSRQSAVSTGRYGAFLQGMRELGYVEGTHFVVEERFVPDWNTARLAAVAAELVKLKVDLIVVTGGPTIIAVRQATSSIPVVVTIASDPLFVGIATSLSRPGGNFTGFSAILDEVSPKHIEYLQIAVPKLGRIGVLAKLGNPTNSRLRSRIEAEAAKRDLHVIAVDVDAQKDIDSALARFAQQRAEAFIILGDSFFVEQSKHIADIAIRHRLPSIYTGAEYPIAGGLMSYGPDFSDNFRRVAGYVDKILKGAKPGDLPFEQPNRFYLTINKRTAKALGVTISNELLLRADKVIE